MSIIDRPKRPKGRPRVMTTEVQQGIIDRMICGESLVSICLDEHMPERSVIYRYLAGNAPGSDDFRESFQRAVVLRTINMAEEIIAIGDDNSRDWQIREEDDGSTSEVFNRDHVVRSKLMCENRWKFLEKLQPSRYGRNLTLTGENAGAARVTIVHHHFPLPDEEPTPKVAPSRALIEHDYKGRDEDADDI